MFENLNFLKIVWLEKQGDFIWKLSNKPFAWIIFDTLLFISTLSLHLQPTYWILFEGNKLVVRDLFLTVTQHYIRNSRGNAFKHQNWFGLNPLVKAQKIQIYATEPFNSVHSRPRPCANGAHFLPWAQRKFHTRVRRAHKIRHRSEFWMAKADYKRRASEY